MSVIASTSSVPLLPSLMSAAPIWAMVSLSMKVRKTAPPMPPLPPWAPRGFRKPSGLSDLSRSFGFLVASGEKILMSNMPVRLTSCILVAA